MLLAVLFVGIICCIISAIVDLEVKCQPLAGIICWPKILSHFLVWGFLIGKINLIYYSYIQYICYDSFV